MNADIKEILENISLMIVMTSPGDKSAIDILISLCEDAQKLAAQIGNHPRFVAAVEHIKSKRDTADVLTVLTDFTNAAAMYTENAGAAAFPGEQSAASGSEHHPDISPTADKTFLVEFIETHSLLLEDFEGTIVEFQRTNQGEEEATKAVKRYLHNVKGDSGSIGLTGIERTCHSLEDAFGTFTLSDMAPILLGFKEWVLECLTALASGATPPRTAAEFLTFLPAEPQPEIAAAAPATTTPPPAPTSAAVAGEYSLSGEPEILLEFAAEAEEHLNNVESVILESEGAFGSDAVDTIFRGVHSLKGGSAYFTIDEMTKCSHILENFLSEVRDGKRKFDPALHSLLLVYIDLQKDCLKRAKAAAGKSGKMAFSNASTEFLASLERYALGEGVVEVAPVAANSEAPTDEKAAATEKAALPAEAAPEAAERSTDAQQSSKLQVKDFVKVDTARLDHLIDSIGEMVIYSSMLVRLCRELLPNHEGVMDTTHRVEKFSRDLQDIGMSMRLVPIKGLFQKMSRLVWDTSKKLGKNIQFSMHGEDTELDRNLIDKLADPLMHMVRNSLDHGVEPSDERERKGKPKTGNVTLSAFHSGGSIHIQIKDDGRGLNPDKLVAKATERGIIQPGQKLTQSEIFQLIFAPGFSTAAVVTDISGRGVGMDVVRRNVESLRGRIHIQSEVDKGSTFTIELPLTLAIIDGIQIRVGTEHFIVPSLSIVEFVRPRPEMISNTLDVGETFHFRGKYLPVFRLSRLYEIPAEFTEPAESTIIVVENGHELVALMVDEVLGQYSTVIKSLGSTFDDGKGLAGCAIMPSGDVALILDIRSLVQLARLVYRPDYSTASVAAQVVQ